MLGHDSPVRSHYLCGSENRPKISRVLNLIKEESGLSPLTGDGEDILERSILRFRHARHDTLMMWSARDGRELVSGAIRDLDPRFPRQPEQFLERGPAPLGQHGDLLHLTAAGAQQLQHRVAPEE